MAEAQVQPLWCSPALSESALAAELIGGGAEVVLDYGGWGHEGGALARACASAGKPLLQLSSARVFGQASSPWLEACTIAPIDEAGRRFAVAESLAALSHNHLILRLPWVLDLPGGLMAQLLERLSAGGELAVSDQVRGAAITLHSVARAAVAMSRQVMWGADNWGVFHLRSADTCTEAELADFFARALKRSGCAAASVRVGPAGPLSPYPAALEGNRLTDDFGIQLQPWRHGLKGRVKHWLGEQAAPA